MTEIEIIGQIIGVIATALCCLACQMKKKETLLLVQTGGVILFSLQYFLIGAISGGVLNSVCVIRNIVFYIQEDKAEKDKAKGETKAQGKFAKYFAPVLFAVAICICSAFSWKGWYDVFILSALAINTLCIGTLSAQNFRKSLVLTCILALCYNVIVFSIGGIINECITIVSSIIGLIRHREKK